MPLCHLALLNQQVATVRPGKRGLEPLLGCDAVRIAWCYCFRGFGDAHSNPPGNAIMAQITNKPPENFWPMSLAHLAQPYITAEDDYVTIGEISSEPVNGFAGNRMFFTALVPKGEINEVVAARGGIGTEIRCWGPRPDVDPEGGYDGAVWIDASRDAVKKYVTAVNSWRGL